MSPGRRLRGSGKEDKEWSVRGPSAGWWALTGTPGTGKSAAARRVPVPVVAVELGTLAEGAGARALGDRSAPVDLDRLSRYVRRRTPPGPVLVVGHLAHLLPIRRTIALRCDPSVLERRLRRRRDPGAARRANVEAEAIDLVVAEARRDGRDLVEIDTTHRSPSEVADRVAARVLAGDRRSDPIDWLADRSVTARLVG